MMQQTIILAMFSTKTAYKFLKWDLEMNPSPHLWIRRLTLDIKVDGDITLWLLKLMTTWK